MCSVHSTHEGIMLDTQREKEEVGGVNLTDIVLCSI